MLASYSQCGSAFPIQERSTATGRKLAASYKSSRIDRDQFFLPLRMELMFLFSGLWVLRPQPLSTANEAVQCPQWALSFKKELEENVREIVRERMRDESEYELE